MGVNIRGKTRGEAPARKATLSAGFDRIFGHKTGFATLDRPLARQRANKQELLKVLERLDIPLHTNGSENDIRCHVQKRKVSGETRSEDGRAFLGNLKTCFKNGIEFWDYFGARLKLPNSREIPDLAQVVYAALAQWPP